MIIVTKHYIFHKSNLNRARQKGSSTGIPPLVYSDEEEPVHAHAHYSLFVYKHRGKLAHYFNLSHGPDIVLLPITVGILYDYIIDKLEERNNQNKLDLTILDLLDSYNLVDCRSFKGLFNLPSEVLLRNKIGY